jgi:hypothetical protein
MRGCQPPGAGRCITAPDKVSGSRRFYVIIRVPAWGGGAVEGWRRRPLMPLKPPLAVRSRFGRVGGFRPFRPDGRSRGWREVRTFHACDLRPTEPSCPAWRGRQTAACWVNWDRRPGEWLAAVLAVRHPRQARRRSPRQSVPSTRAFRSLLARLRRPVALIGDASQGPAAKGIPPILAPPGIRRARTVDNQVADLGFIHSKRPGADTAQLATEMPVRGRSGRYALS